MANKYPTKEAHSAAMRAQMAITRAKFPHRFNAKKNGATTAFKKKAATGAFKKNKSSPVQSAAPDPAPVTAPAPAAAPIIPAATTAQILTSATPAPVQSAAPDPAPVTAPAPNADLIILEPEILQSSEIFTPIPPSDVTPDTQPLKSTEPEPEKKKEDRGTNSPGLNRSLATMVWGMILQISVMIFGQGMLPRIFETPAGKIDENENVIIAWCEYLDSLGFTKLSPLWNLILTVAAYFLLRIQVVLLWFKNRKMHSAMKPERTPDRPETKEQPERPRPDTEPKPAPKAEPTQTPDMREELLAGDTGF